MVDLSNESPLPFATSSLARLARSSVVGFRLRISGPLSFLTTLTLSQQPSLVYPPRMTLAMDRPISFDDDALADKKRVSVPDYIFSYSAYELA